MPAMPAVAFDYRPPADSAKAAPPYFLVCHALALYEDGWAAFRLMATCRRAWNEAGLVASDLRRARRALLDMLRYVQTKHLFMPGFNPQDELVMELHRLTAWDPPLHRSLVLSPPAFMDDGFEHASQRNMDTWIEHHPNPRYRNLVPLDVLRAMNPSKASCPSFNAVMEVLLHGGARFIYSPIVYHPGQPMEEQLVPGPGLVIVLRYRSFPIVLCCRYSDDYYIAKMFLPWFTHVHGSEDGLP